MSEKMAEALAEVSLLGETQVCLWESEEFMGGCGTGRVVTVGARGVVRSQRADGQSHKGWPRAPGQFTPWGDVCRVEIGWREIDWSWWRILDVRLGDGFDCVSECAAGSHGIGNRWGGFEDRGCGFDNRASRVIYSTNATS